MHSWLPQKKVRLRICSSYCHRACFNKNTSYNLDSKTWHSYWRKGQELDSLRDSLNRTVGKEVRLEIQEIKKPDLVASLVAESVALQLESRIAFRRAMKKAVQTTMSMGAEGIRIQCAGRLAGADIAQN